MCVLQPAPPELRLIFVSVAALLNTISLYHDTLLNRVIQSDPKYKPLIPSTPHSRYARAWVKKDSKYKWFARILGVLRYLEPLIEMSLQRKASNKVRWRVVVLIECVKYVFSFHLRQSLVRPGSVPLYLNRQGNSAFRPSTYNEAPFGRSPSA